MSQTRKKHKKHICKTTTRRRRRRLNAVNKSEKTFLYNPLDPQRSFDVYIDKNPDDTISIKYTTHEDVKDTIRKLEHLYKNRRYSHKRIWQVGMIMKVRLEAIYKRRKTVYKNAKNITGRYMLAKRYFEFLSQRTKMNESERRNSRFIV